MCKMQTSSWEGCTRCSAVTEMLPPTFSGAAWQGEEEWSREDEWNLVEVARKISAGVPVECDDGENEDGGDGLVDDEACACLHNNCL